MRKRYTAAFKEQIVQEVLKEEKTIAQIASEYEVHPNQYFPYYNQERLHQSLDYKTPRAVYFGSSIESPKEMPWGNSYNLEANQMRIHIESIDTKLSQHGGNTGYRINFHSELTRGSALLAATHSVGPTLRGQEIFVEVEATSFQDMHVLLTEEPHQYRLEALPQQGDYQAVGRVEYAISNEDNRIGVRVADALFHWTPDDSERNDFSLGVWVRFTVVELILWDINL